MKSVMQHQFSLAPQVLMHRSRFDRSCGYKTTLDAGYLIPFYIDEVLPGDTFDVNATIFGRLATPIVPFMDNVFIDTFFFFVPNRLVWNHFQNFMGEQENPDDSTDYLVPTITSPEGGFPLGTPFDYAALPCNNISDSTTNTGDNAVTNPITGSISVNALPFRAMNRIYNEWFRDENLQESLKLNLDDGPDDYADYPLFRRGKRYDYFTSCLPWPQKGPAVELPLNGDAPISIFGNGMNIGVIQGSKLGGLYTSQKDSNGWLKAAVDYYGKPQGESQSRDTLFSGSSEGVGLTPDPTMSGIVGIADLSNVTSATINSLRQAFQLQKFYERDARGGTRYIEKILSHFGVKSPDARLQRTEYLGGGSSRLNVNQVEQNSATDSNSPLGNLAAYGLFGSNKNGFVKSFVEHGYVIGFINVRADLTYQQGIDRMWSRRTVTDFYWPSFAHLGEQAVLNKEIYATGTSTDDEVFGYQERYAEYRYKPSKVTAKFRSNIQGGSLDVWHLSQYLDNLPTLSSQFIEDKPPIERVVAVTDEPHFLIDMYIKNICIRPLPMYGIPGLVDHF